jgi:hypothetical protein
MTEKIPGTIENWENRTLGADEQFVHVAAPEDSDALDEALGIKRITLRLNKELFGKVQVAALDNHASHQWFIKRILSYVMNDEEVLKKALDSFLPHLDDESAKEKPE